MNEMNALSPSLAVITALREYGSLRPEVLGNLIGQSSSRVSRVVTSLKDEGILCENGEGRLFLQQDFPDRLD